MTTTSKQRIDFSKLFFPSDELTIGKIRAANPGSAFFADNDRQPTSVSGYRGPILDMLRHERKLARHAFEEILHNGGKMDSPLKRDRNTLWELGKHYERYGVSADIEATERLVAEIERAAANQAEIYLRNRSRSTNAEGREVSTSAESLQSTEGWRR